MGLIHEWILQGAKVIRNFASRPIRCMCVRSSEFSTGDQTPQDNVTSRMRVLSQEDADRQTDRQSVRQTDRETDKETCRHRGKQTCETEADKLLWN